MECQCTQEDHLCDLCCKDGEKGTCLPASEIEEMKKGKNLKQFPGAPCNDFNGYCDVFLKCRAVDADGPLSRLKNKFFSKEAIKGYLDWIKEYWWAVVLMGVGLILLMAGTVNELNLCLSKYVLENSVLLRSMLQNNERDVPAIQKFVRN